MSTINLQQLMAESKTPHRVLLEQTRGLVRKWSPTGLLEGLDNETERHGMSVLLENQARQLIDEITTTNISPAGVRGTSQEQWNGVALPLVRKVFGEIAAKEFVSIQPMNLPSGLVFYMDFRYGTTQKPFTSGDSVFGISETGPNMRGESGFPTASTVPQGGLYGAGRFGYTSKDVVTAPLNIGTHSLAPTSASVDFDQAAVALLPPGTNGLAFYRVPLTNFTNPDRHSARAFVPISASQAGTESLDGWLPAFTFISGSGANEAVYFVAKTFDTGDGSGGETQSLYGVQYIKQPADTTRGDFEDSRAELVNESATAQASLGIPQIDLELRSVPIVAKTRKLKAVWTPELAQDLNAYHSIDAEAELTAMLSEYISLEIDLEILDMLILNAQTVDFWSVKIGRIYNTTQGDFVNDPNIAGQAWTNQTWFETLGQKIQKVSNKIHQLTLRGGANFLVCAPDVATILETIPGFTVETDGDKMKFAAGVTQIGSFQNRYTVYKNPYMTSNVILLGYKGANFLETGAVYSPYVPLVLTPLVYDPDNFTPRRGVMTRYAKKMLRPEFYGKIYVDHLQDV